MKIIYADGSSLGNPGPAGYGVVAIDTERGKYWEWGKGFPKATNNQMELQATIMALKVLKESSGEGTVEMKLDSKYVLDGVQKWSKGWVKNNWLNSQKEPVKNQDEWKEILELVKQLKDTGVDINWKHIYSHTGETWNERVDEIAKSFAKGTPVELRKSADLPKEY